MKVWASGRSIQAEIADVPDNWLRRFMVERPDDVRKFGESKNSTLTFRVSAVLESVEQGLYFRPAPVPGEAGKADADERSA